MLVQNWHLPGNTSKVTKCGIAAAGSSQVSGKPAYFNLMINRDADARILGLTLSMVEAKRLAESLERAIATQTSELRFSDPGPFGAGD